MPPFIRWKPFARSASYESGSQIELPTEVSMETAWFAQFQLSSLDWVCSRVFHPTLPMRKETCGPDPMSKLLPRNE